MGAFPMMASNLILDVICGQLKLDVNRCDRENSVGDLQRGGIIIIRRAARVGLIILALKSAADSS